MLAYLLAMLETDADKAIIEAIVRQYERKVQAICFNILRKQHDTEDAMMATWIKIIKHIDTTRNYYSKPIFEPWLFTIARNAATDEWRRRKRAPEPIEIWRTPTTGIGATGPDSELQMMMDAIRSLPPQMRKVLEMRGIAEYTWKEIGKELKCSATTAQRQFERAKAELDRRLNI